jgi:hypothetical protein
MRLTSISSKRRASDCVFECEWDGRDEERWDMSYVICVHGMGRVTHLSLAKGLPRQRAFAHLLLFFLD